MFLFLFFFVDESENPVRNMAILQQGKPLFITANFISKYI